MKQDSRKKLVMSDLSNNLFKQLPEILKFYQSQNTSSAYTNKHFQYVLQLQIYKQHIKS